MRSGTFGFNCALANVPKVKETMNAENKSEEDRNSHLLSVLWVRTYCLHEKLVLPS